jgi:hypothetical protein
VNDTTLTREVIDSLISKTDLTEPTRLLIRNDTSSGKFYSVKCNTKVVADIIFIAELLKKFNRHSIRGNSNTTGRKWWLVVMDKKTGTKNDLYKGWGERENCFAGWISSRFVRLSE